MVKKSNNRHWDLLTKISNYLHNNIQSVNNSKVFAGIVIITLNISSKFVTIKLPKTLLTMNFLEINCRQGKKPLLPSNTVATTSAYNLQDIWGSNQRQSKCPFL